MSHPSTPSSPSATLGIIRISMLVGVLIFGMVTYFLHLRPEYTAPGDNQQMRMALGVVMLLATFGILFARWKLGTIREEAQLGTFQIMGWAAGEAAALAGGVYYMLTDNPNLYIIGLFVLLASFIVIPLRRT